MPEPNNNPLAYEALLTKGLKELSCGCVIQVKRSGIIHARVCRTARTIYRDVYNTTIHPSLPGSPFVVSQINCPTMYFHFAKGVLT